MRYQLRYVRVFVGNTDETKAYLRRGAAGQAGHALVVVGKMLSCPSAPQPGSAPWWRPICAR